MIVMTMILTRLTVKSSGFRAKSGIHWAKQAVILALPSLSNKFTYAQIPKIVQ
jgi:hypothetical protein